MDIESKLKSAIEKCVSAIPSRLQQVASSRLSDAYRDPKSGFLRSKPNDLLYAYLASRMPATFAVIDEVLCELKRVTPALPRKILDIGAGPATASFAALQHFEIQDMTLFEERAEFKDIALTLAKAMDLPEFSKSTWEMRSVTINTKFPAADLAIASYSLGEMPTNLALEVVEKAFNATDIFIIVEPGTPFGFERIRNFRDHLITRGAHILAPCPHQKSCPMKAKDFCHFKARLARESFHRTSKNASLPYEDESYSYIIAAKHPRSGVAARIVKKPMKRPGHVIIDTCENGSIQRHTITRSDKLLYKQAKDARWGDAIFDSLT